MLELGLKEINDLALRCIDKASLSSSGSTNERTYEAIIAVLNEERYAGHLSIPLAFMNRVEQAILWEEEQERSS